MNNTIRPINLIDRIAEDLRTGTLSFPASENLLQERYGRYPGELPWREYREAARIAGATDGTLVIVDDTNCRFVAATDFDGDFTDIAAGIFFSAATTRYLEGFADEPAKEVRLTLYRLPRGRYSKKANSFFWENAEYVGERSGKPDAA